MIKKLKRRRRTKVKHGTFSHLKYGSGKELRFLKESKRYGWETPTKPKRIETPLGYYTPDFELKDKYVEIKSEHTFFCCLGREAYKFIGSPDDLQFRKICWVNDNLKKVLIRVYISNKDYKPDLKGIDLKGIEVQLIGGKTKKIKVKY